MTEPLAILLEALGALAIVAGIALIYLPAAFIVAGLLLVFAANVYAKRSTDADTDDRPS